MGRGTQRGPAVVATNGLFTSEKGWQWGPADAVQRWGVNVISAIVNGDSVIPLPGGTTSGTVGDLLKCSFDASGGGDEAHLSVGDSSGGLFIQDGGIWKLAGINYAVDGPYNTSSTGPGFNAAIYDEGGLYKGGPGNWSLTPDLPLDLPGGFYATRVSAHVTWINSVLQASPPADPPPVVLSATNVTGPFLATPDAVVDANARTVTLPKPSSSRYYRLQGCSQLRILTIRIIGATLVMTYE
jgi:hypothetical protein